MPLPALPAIGAATNGFRDITGAITDITDLFSDKNTSQKGTQTTSIDKEGMTYLLNQILGSTQGLSSVTGMDNIAGLYNSATTNLLTNDLLARTAGEVAARNSTVRTTSESEADAPLGGIGDAIGNITDSLGLKVPGAGSDLDFLLGAPLGLATDPVGTVKKGVKKVKKAIKKIF